MSRPDAPRQFQPVVTAKTIDQTAAVIRKIRPDYSPMIDFYSQIFAAQAASQVLIDPIRIPPDLLALKKENQMPLISPVEFSVDLAAARSLMMTAASLAFAHAPKLAHAAGAIQTALDQDNLNLADLFKALLDSQTIAGTADQLGISPQDLGFFGFTALAPSLEAGAAQLAVYLEPGMDHHHGYCPICGSHPDLGFLDEKGNRRVICALCHHTWKVKRMGCLFCEAKSPEGQNYFFSSEEKEYRIYHCESCKTYLKLIDTRELGRRFVPKLEQVASLHMDIKAQEQGYSKTGNCLA